MLTRRGFLGALAAIVAVPKAMLAREPLIALNLQNIGAITGIPVFDNSVVARRIYRSSGDGAYKLIATINYNETTTYTDDSA